MSSFRPFLIDIPEADIEDLRKRLQHVRWPQQISSDEWVGGVPLKFMKELHQYWLKEYDWSKHETMLNGFCQFVGEVGGRDLHFIHERSTHENAMPIMITHGWPGSVLEFRYLIRRLTQPEEFGIDTDQAFHVVCPSIPGYTFSEAADTAGMTTAKVAAVNAELMEKLGYDKYMVQGGDWGSMISANTARLFPERVCGLHLNMLFAFPPAEQADPMAGLSDRELADVANAQVWQTEGNGYFRIQATKPNTLGFALTDSPIGLAAWIVEKFHGWTDCNNDPQQAISFDDMLTNICLYWFTGSITSSSRLYYETEHDENPSFSYIDTPTAGALFPVEIANAPRAWCEQVYNIQRWTRFNKGGHFAALEAPEDLAEDIRAFAVQLRDS